MLTRKAALFMGMAATALAGCTTDSSGHPHFSNPLDSQFGPQAVTVEDARHFNPARNAGPLLESSELRKRIMAELDIGNNHLDRPITPTEYTAAGYNYVYRNCSNYFDYLIMLQNANGYRGDLVSSSGTAIAAMMGLANSSAAAIGAVAATTGFATSAFNNYNTRALMTSYPNETKTLILSGLDKYRHDFSPEGIASDSEAIINVQHMAEMCTYSGITRAAKQAIAGATAQVQSAASTESLTLQAGISGKLGLATSLTRKELANLYAYVLGEKYKSADAAAILKNLPVSIQEKLGVPPAEPTGVKGLVGVNLKQLYTDDAEFRKLADIAPADPKPAPASDPIKPPPAAEKTTSTTTVTTTSKPSTTAPKAVGAPGKVRSASKGKTSTSKPAPAKVEKTTTTTTTTTTPAPTKAGSGSPSATSTDTPMTAKIRPERYGTVDFSGRAPPPPPPPPPPPAPD